MLLAEAVEIPTGVSSVRGDLRVPAARSGLVICVEGTGCSRLSGRDRRLAELLEIRGMATLLVDLAAGSENPAGEEYPVDIERLGHRLSAVVDWAAARSPLGVLPVGLSGAATGAAAAMVAASCRPASIAAVVSRGGRPDLAGAALTKVVAPTLLIVGAEDDDVMEANEAAMRQIGGLVELEVVPGATHLFDEPGAMERAAALASAWFLRHLTSPGASAATVPRREWTEFLAGFSRRHRDCLVTVTAEATGRQPQEISARRPLAWIETVEHGSRVAAIEIRFADLHPPVSVTAIGPKVVRAYETARGLEAGLEIEDQYGLRTRVRLGPSRVLRCRPNPPPAREPMHHLFEGLPCSTQTREILLTATPST